MKKSDLGWLKHHRTLIVSLCAVVVFITTYLLILPALTLDKDKAEEQGGITVTSETSDEKVDASDTSVSEEKTEKAQEQKADQSASTEKKSDEKKSDEKQSNTASYEGKEEDESPVYKAGKLSYEGEGYDIEIAYEKSAKIPEGTKLIVKEIEKKDDTTDYIEYYSKALKAVKEDNVNKLITKLENAKFYDISLMADGSEIEPADDVRVSISYDKGLSAEKADLVRVVHFKEDENTGETDVEVLNEEDVDATVKKGKMEDAAFKAVSFSVYGVIVEPAPSGVNNLDEQTVYISNTLDNATHYLGNTVVSANNIQRINKVDDSCIAAEWTFEATETEGVYFISTMTDDGKRYINFTRYDDTRANVFLSANPQPLTVTMRNNKYLIGDTINGRTYYLNQFDGNSGMGFAAYAYDGAVQAQLDFTFADPPALQKNEEYAIVIHHTDGKYYVVQNDGSLAPVKSYSPETGEIETVLMSESTMMWSYQSVGSIVGDNPNPNAEAPYVLRHRSDAYAFDNVGLPLGFEYTYINVNESDGIDNARDDYVPINKTEYDRVTSDSAIAYDAQNHRLAGAENDHFLGVVADDDGNLHITGVQGASSAAEVYFAKATNVHNSTIRNNAVNHVDISVDGTAGITVPLAYGEYKLAIVDDEGNIIGYREQPLVVTRENPYNATAERIVEITPQDIKTGDFSAYTLYKGYKDPIDDVFSVTGYTGNAPGSNETAQVRMEGTFKVSDVDPVPAGEDVNSDRVKAERLQKKIYYTLSVEKEVDFTLTYVDEDDPNKPTYVIIRDEEPFTVNVKTTLTNTFTYWDEANECPGIDVAWGGRDAWRQGEIHENTAWYSGADARPGMDFRLDAPKGDTRHDIVAIEVMKFVQGDFGTEVRTLELQEGTQCLINVYQNNNKLHDKTLTVGTDGIGMIYDYDVTAGTYEAPAYAQISESANSVANEIVDAEGNVWTYDHSRVETEYVWRDFNQPSLHISEDYNKETEGGEFYSESEILGEYRWAHYPEHYTYNGQDHDGNEFNRFLEFYVYNIYKPKAYPLYIKKVDEANPNYQNDDGLAGAKFDVYGPYSQAEIEEEGFNPIDADKKWNSSAIETTTGSVKIGDFTDDGIYYLIETQAPPGYVLSTEPIKFVVDSSKADQEAISVAPDSQQVMGSVYNQETESMEAHLQVFISNPVGAELPHTGGHGTALFYILGSMLTLGAGMLFIRRRREA